MGNTVVVQLWWQSVYGAHRHGAGDRPEDVRAGVLLNRHCERVPEVCARLLRKTAGRELIEVGTVREYWSNVGCRGFLIYMAGLWVILYGKARLAEKLLTGWLELESAKTAGGVMQPFMHEECVLDLQATSVYIFLPNCVPCSVLRFLPQAIDLSLTVRPARKNPTLA